MTAPKQSFKSLTFAALPKLEADPVQERRTKTIARLEEQKLLFANPNYTRTVRTSVKGDDGARTVVEKQQRVAPWWVSTRISAVRSPYINHLLSAFRTSD
jgi:hypothetical protein